MCTRDLIKRTANKPCLNVIVSREIRTTRYTLAQYQDVITCTYVHMRHQSDIGFNDIAKSYCLLKIVREARYVFKTLKYFIVLMQRDNISDLILFQ